MGDTASKINWNPLDSPLFQGTVDWNPLNSTLGQLAQGNYGEAGRGAAGGVQNLANTWKDIGMGFVNPGAAYKDIYGSISGETGARQRREQDIFGQQQDQARRQAEYAGWNQQMNQQQAAQKRNQDYLNRYSADQAATADADAYQRAKDAARRAKGTQLFGAYNG